MLLMLFSEWMTQVNTSMCFPLTRFLFPLKLCYIGLILFFCENALAPFVLDFQEELYKDVSYWNILILSVMWHKQVFVQ